MQSSRLKVCHILHEGSSGGGGATYALAYFPAYLGEYDVFAIVGRNGDLGAQLEAKGVRTFTLPLARPLPALLFLPQLWNILWREKPAAVILHGQWAGFLGAVAARLAGVKAILYYTQFPSFYTDWDFARIVRNRIAEEVSCHFATRIVCPSRANLYQYLLRRLAPEEKFVHIPNGVAPPEDVSSADRASLRATLNLPGDPTAPLVVSVSRLADQKRIDWLLRAWALVEQEAPTAQLAIIGGGPLEQDLQRLARALRLQRCHFLGPQPQGHRYYQAADLGVITSLYEGHPLSLLEAMFCACPMVGTAADGIAETILDGETGLLVPPADVPALARALLELLTQPARAQKMGRAARARAEQNYRLEDVVEKQRALLRQTLREEIDT